MYDLHVIVFLIQIIFGSEASDGKFHLQEDIEEHVTLSAGFELVKCLDQAVK